MSSYSSVPDIIISGGPDKLWSLILASISSGLNGASGWGYDFVPAWSSPLMAFSYFSLSSIPDIFACICLISSVIFCWPSFIDAIIAAVSLASSYLSSALPPAASLFLL